MDKETGKLDLSRWVIVHDSPTLAWIGELQDPVFWQIVDHGKATPVAHGQLEPALVLQTLFAQGPGGMGMLTHVTPPHGLASPLALVVDGLTVTLVRQLSEGDQHDLRTKIEAVFKSMVAHRAAQSGIAMPPVKR